MTALVLVLTLALVLLVAALSAPRDSKGIRHLLSGYSIVLASFALYGLFPAGLLLVRGGEFYWATGFEANHGLVRAVAFTGVALLAFLYGYSIATRRRRVDSESRRSVRVGSIAPPRAGPRRAGRTAVMVGRRSSSWTTQIDAADVGTAPRRLPAAWQVAIGLVIVGLLMRLYVVAELGGIGSTVARLSGASRSHLGLDNASPLLVQLLTLAGIANAGATWLLVMAIRSRRPVYLPALVFLLVLASSFLVSGKRLFLILPLLVVLCAIHVYRRPVTFRWAPWLLLAVPALGMATLLSRVFLPAAQADIVVNLDEVDHADGSAFDFYFNSLEFSTTEMLAVAIASADDINASLGGNVEAFVATNLEALHVRGSAGRLPGETRVLRGHVSRHLGIGREH